MLEKSKENINFVIFCDEAGCGEEHTLTEDFWSSLDEAHAAGWKSKKVRGDWEHSCPACVKGER